ncbi:MAG: amidohydrolase family protein [Xanthomonadales bacterium]|nr:amidohydrolase family protein [Xanthomonadales bacterium]
MNPFVRVSWAAFFILATACTSNPLSGSTAPASEHTPEIAIEHVSVIDASNASPRLDQTVVVRGNRIVRVASSRTISLSDDAQRVDARGKFLIPGLFDAHAHTWYAGIDHRRLFIANGITAIRDPAAPWDHLRVINQWREEIERGKAVGPRIWATGQPVVGPASQHPWPIKVTDATEARAAVRRLKNEGADFVKILNRLPPESFHAVIDEAKRNDLTVAGHIPRELSARAIAEAGLSVVEHASLGGLMLASATSEAASRERLLSGTSYLSELPELLATFDRHQAEGVYRMLREHDVAVTPTVVFFEALAETAEGDPAAVRNDWLRYTPRAYGEIWSRQLGQLPTDTLSANLERSRDALRAMKSAGVKVLAGTDTIKPFLIPGFSLHRELEIMVAAGFSELDALEAATRAPAEVLGASDVGLIAEGMLADLVLLDANPLADISNTQMIHAAFANGRLFKRNELDRMLSEIEQAAAEWVGEPSTFP